MNPSEKPAHGTGPESPGILDADRENRFSPFFRISEALLFMIDAHFRLFRINRAALSVLGFSWEEMAGRPFVDLIDDDGKKELLSHLAVASNDIRQMESLTFRAKDGRKVVTQARITRGGGESENLVYMAAWDVSRYRTGEEKFKKVFHSTSVVMLIFALESGIILEANEAACAMTGYRPGEMVGKTIDDLDIYPDRRERRRIKTLLQEQGGLKDFEILVKNRNGWECHGLFSMDVLRLDEEPVVLAVGNDFTLRKKAEDALMMAYRDQGKQKQIIERKSRELEKAKHMLEKSSLLIEESSRHKSEFIANMSHELRTPLNSIILLANLLAQNREGRLSGKELEYATVIAAAGQDLLTLINDVLDLSKVEAGRMEVNLSRVSLEYLCRKMRGYFSEMAGVKGLEFGIFPEPGLTEYLFADVQKLEQILKNLTSNAIKFTEKGSVRIFIKRPAVDADLSMIGLEGLEPERSLAFSVTDTGIGIAPESRNLIFECYRQAGKGIAGTYGGTGLGLPVSRMLAQLLGGDIFVESEPMKGSTFTLYIPDNAQENMERADVPLPAILPEDKVWPVRKIRESRINGCKILVADDDMRTVYALIQNLEVMDVEVIVAWDGFRCLKKLKEHPDIGLLLLDLAMPGMDGLQVLEHIRSDEKTKNLPVLVISADVMKGGEKDCLEAGADGYAAKPLDFKNLVGMMENLLGPDGT